MKNISIKLTSDTLSLQECYAFVEDPACGGIDVFVGNGSKSHSEKKTVESIWIFQPTDRWH